MTRDRGPHPAHQSRWAAIAIIALIGLVGMWWLAGRRATPTASRPTMITACHPWTPAEAIRQADLIMTGQVFIVLPSRLGAEIVIEPGRVFHGQLPEGAVRVVAKPVTKMVMSPDGSEPELHFTSDQPPYLLVLRRRTDGLYETRSCWGSRLLGPGLRPEEEAAWGVRLDNPAD
ncbi:MAG: hypothetical protein HYY50_02290 [Candidatus Kerfeldbacteria bacterium]|nr:hypothetical protein [Candidatus Kerfeldbacteria bacterium]